MLLVMSKWMYIYISYSHAVLVSAFSIKVWQAWQLENHNVWTEYNLFRFFVLFVFATSRCVRCSVHTMLSMAKFAWLCNVAETLKKVPPSVGWDFAYAGVYLHYNLGVKYLQDMQRAVFLFFCLCVCMCVCVCTCVCVCVCSCSCSHTFETWG